MKEENATLIAFLLSPVVPGVAFALSSPGLGGGLSGSVASVVALSFLGYMYSLLAVGFLALPAYLVLHRYGLVHLWSSFASGAVLGAVLPSILSLPLTAVPFMCSLGAATGLVFWGVRNACLRSGRTKVPREP